MVVFAANVAADRVGMQLAVGRPDVDHTVGDRRR